MIKKLAILLLLVQSTIILSMNDRIEWDKVFCGTPLIVLKKQGASSIYFIKNRSFALELVKSPNAYRAQMKQTYRNGGVQTMIFVNEKQEILKNQYERCVALDHDKINWKKVLESPYRTIN